MKQRKRKEKGITLIALVITIIVLLILAGVTINLVVGDNGIIGKAKNAKQNMTNAQGEENVQLRNLQNYIEELEGTIQTKPSIPEGVVLPMGFYYVDGTIENGVVISDKEGDDLANNRGGNQFVWVPVEPGEYKQNFNYKSNFGATAANTIDEALPTGVSKELIESKGGFYIARFEAGDETTTIARTRDSLQTIKPVSKKGKQIYNYIAQENAKAISESFLNNEEVISGLITGSGWDTTMAWLEKSGYNVTDSKIWGNHSNSTVEGHGRIQTTGYSESWQANHIYDLAGNGWEYISERNTIHDYKPFVRHGGADDLNSSDYSASCRNICFGTEDFSSTFRFVLYLK